MLGRVMNTPLDTVDMSQINKLEAASYIYVNHSQHDQFLDIVWPENILVTLVMNHQNGYKKQLELQWRT